MKTKCSKFTKRQNKTQKSSSLDVNCVFFLQAVPSSLSVEMILELPESLMKPTFL